MPYEPADEELLKQIAALHIQEAFRVYKKSPPSVARQQSKEKIEELKCRICEERAAAAPHFDRRCKDLGFFKAVNKMDGRCRRCYAYKKRTGVERPPDL